MDIFLSFIAYEVVESYTEELIFLMPLLINGLHLNIATVPQATVLILVFFTLRIAVKFIDTYMGASPAKSEPAIRKYNAGWFIAPSEYYYWFGIEYLSE